MSGIARMFGRPAAIVAAALALSAASSCAPDEPVVQAVTARDGAPPDVAPARSDRVCDGVRSEPMARPTPTPDLDGLDPMVIRNQELIHDVIDPALEPHYDVKRSGFADAAVYQPELTALIRWKGAPPPDIERLRGTNPSGVTVRIACVPYSEADVRAAVRRLGHAGTDGRIPRFDRASATDAYDGLDIGFVRATLDSIDVERTRAAYAEIARMPITITETERIHPTT